MPNVTLEPQALPKDHPALTKRGKLRARAEALLGSRVMPSRGVPAARRVAECEDMDEALDPVRNTELFYRIADYIELFPEAYNQGDWGCIIEGAITPCGTAFCIAGHAAHETGWKPYTNSWDTLIRPRGKTILDVQDIARAELGITYEEGDVLFSGGWRPRGRMSVSEALRKIGDGAKISSVTYAQGFLTDLKHEERRRPIKVTGIKPKY